MVDSLADRSAKPKVEMMEMQKVATTVSCWAAPKDSPMVAKKVGHSADLLGERRAEWKAEKKAACWAKPTAATKAAC